MQYPITINGQGYTLATNDAAQMAAIKACRDRYNEGKEDADKLSTDAEYLSFVFGIWASSNSGFTNDQLQSAAASAFASYAGQNPPEVLVQDEAPSKDALKAYASQKRWEKEVGGLTFNGIRIPTDDRAKLLLLGAATNMPDGSSSPLIVTGVDYGTLSKAQFVAINAAVIAHVQATFPVLSTVLSAIDAETMTTKSDIDAAFA